MQPVTVTPEAFASATYDQQTHLAARRRTMEAQIAALRPVPEANGRDPRHPPPKVQPIRYPGRAQP